ncbi:MAG: hypothetical protein M2R46_01323 [Verrucomicrobia subdivision 3 bacterium]|nr:hypothetical protein [Limisphaerales bacterium]
MFGPIRSNFGGTIERNGRCGDWCASLVVAKSRVLWVMNGRRLMSREGILRACASVTGLQCRLDRTISEC